MSIEMADAISNEGPLLAKTAEILLTAATRWEAAPLAQGLGLIKVGPGLFDGHCGGRRIRLVQTGIGAVAAASVLDRRYVAGDYGLIATVGLCGALQDGIRRGDLIVDPGETELALISPLAPLAAAKGFPLHFGRLLHTNIVLPPAEKRRLGAEHRRVACDMETAAVRRWASGRTPVLALRGVLDALDDVAPAEAPAGDDIVSLTHYAVTHARDLPALIAVGLRTARTMRTLSRFVRAYLEVL